MCLLQHHVAILEEKFPTKSKCLLFLIFESRVGDGLDYYSCKSVNAKTNLVWWWVGKDTIFKFQYKL